MRMLEDKKSASGGQKPHPRFMLYDEAILYVELQRRLILRLIDVLSDERLPDDLRRAKILALKAIIDG